ncbi:DUF1566 domain-containing protein [Desulfococcaceae bacterium HSG9]|nr:DUF1566 domain-containing protein [Desulfococcaceae bacterium HSG9]
MMKSKLIFLTMLVIITGQAIDSFAEVPVYRLYNTVLQVHLYSTDANEKAVLEADSDWNYEGVVWNGYGSDVGQYPVYRLYSPGLGKHLFTMDENEKNVLDAGPVWQFEKIAWYANATPYSGDIPIYRLYSDGLKQHLYSADENEKNALNGNGVWVYEGIAYYTSSASASTPTPVPTSTPTPVPTADTYPVVDTDQTTCYDNQNAVNCPQAGAAFYGQDAQHTGNAPSFTDNGNGTVSDNNTGLMWQQSPDTDGDGDIDAADKLTWTQIQAYSATLNAQNFGGYSDWRVPSIKELYSLIEFNGTDPMVESLDTSGLIPFIDTSYFDFAYGDTSAGERIIDSQWATSTTYVANSAQMFGVNFADGRIKGYGLGGPFGSKAFFVLCVRGNTSYGVNNFTDNGDGTVSDQATGLMWSQADNGTGMNWLEALAWVEQKNMENYLGHSDWRMPNAKELQSIVDYTRSPDTTGSAAIDPVFSVTSVTNEAGQVDYPFYWTGTTHKSSNGMNGSAVYVAFGRSMGYMNYTWTDVHGAGAQRSDPKSGDPADFPFGRGPQGDSIHIYNYVRCVR